MLRVFIPLLKSVQWFLCLFSFASAVQMCFFLLCSSDIYWPIAQNFQFRFHSFLFDFSWCVLQNDSPFFISFWYFLILCAEVFLSLCFSFITSPIAKQCFASLCYFLYVIHLLCKSVSTLLYPWRFAVNCAKRFQSLSFSFFNFYPYCKSCLSLLFRYSFFPLCKGRAPPLLPTHIFHPSCKMCSNLFFFFLLLLPFPAFSCYCLLYGETR